MDSLNKLRGMQTYLVGPIDNVTDEEATQWRVDMSTFLKSMGVGVLNPCNKPMSTHGETPEFKHQVQSLKDAGDFDEASNLMKPICSVDLRMTDKSDFIVAHLDMNAKMCGSIWELAVARISKKPVLIHVSAGKASLSNWLFGTCNHREMFESWDDMKSYLSGINDGTITPDKRWLFFDESLVF